MGGQVLGGLISLRARAVAIEGIYMRCRVRVRNAGGVGFSGGTFSTIHSRARNI